MNPDRFRLLGALFSAASFMMVGCASIPGEDFSVYDPYEEVNRASYDLTDTIDRTLLVPTARGYRKVLPRPLRQGVLNIFENLRSIDSAVNGLLQARPKAASTELARLLINSSIGIGGIFDIATRWGLNAQDEDFGQTLAVWGVKKSRYLYLPFLGPTTVRDLPATLIHSYLPRLLIGHDYNIGIGTVDVVSARASLLSASDVRDASALDPYAFTRDAYYQRRKFLIYDGRPPLDDLFGDFDDDFNDTDPVRGVEVPVDSTERVR